MCCSYRCAAVAQGVEAGPRRIHSSDGRQSASDWSATFYGGECRRHQKAVTESVDEPPAGLHPNRPFSSERVRFANLSVKDATRRTDDELKTGVWA